MFDLQSGGPIPSKITDIIMMYNVRDFTWPWWSSCYSVILSWTWLEIEHIIKQNGEISFLLTSMTLSILANFQMSFLKTTAKDILILFERLSLWSCGHFKNKVKQIFKLHFRLFNSDFRFWKVSFWRMKFILILFYRFLLDKKWV